MPRYDKYDPYSGGFRAPTDQPVAAAGKTTLTGASLNTAGRVLRDGTGEQRGVVIPHDVKNPGDILDVMTHGEIVECEGLTPGTTYYVQADGTIGDTASEWYVGHTVEAARLVVRFQKLSA